MTNKAIIAFLALGLSLLSACNQETGTPEEQIRNMVSAMETAVEQRSLDNVKELIDAEYSDEWNGSRRSALRALMFYFQGHQSIYLLTRISDIDLSDDATTAKVTVYVGMAGNPVEQTESLISLNADLYRFDIQLVAEGNDWLMKSAKWQRARLEDFEY